MKAVALENLIAIFVLLLPNDLNAVLLMIIVMVTLTVTVMLIVTVTV